MGQFCARREGVAARITWARRVEREKRLAGFMAVPGLRFVFMLSVVSAVRWCRVGRVLGQRGVAEIKADSLLRNPWLHGSQG